MTYTGCEDTTVPFVFSLGGLLFTCFGFLRSRCFHVLHLSAAESPPGWWEFQSFTHLFNLFGGVRSIVVLWTSVQRRYSVKQKAELLEPRLTAPRVSSSTATPKSPYLVASTLWPRAQAWVHNAAPAGQSQSGAIPTQGHNQGHLTVLLGKPSHHRPRGALHSRAAAAAMARTESQGSLHCDRTRCSSPCGPRVPSPP